MSKIATPQELAQEIRRLLDYCQRSNPSRAKVASALEDLSNRVAYGSVNWGDDDPRAPKTPWGRAQYGYELAKGVWLYGTAGHGGIKVSRGSARALSPAAIKMADNWGGAYWYEEDVAINIPLYEVPAWNDSLKRKAGGGNVSREQMEQTIRRYFPKYFKLLEEEYELPPMPKRGENWRFAKPLRFGGGMNFEPGDEIEVLQVSRGSVIFVSDKYPGQRFRLRQSDVIDGAIEPA